MTYVPDFITRRVEPSLEPAHALGCALCARRYAEMYLLPTFGLDLPDGPANVVCGECFPQITFGRPPAATRVVLAAA
jgi:hypothetical protein